MLRYLLILLTLYQGIAMAEIEKNSWDNDQQNANAEEGQQTPSSQESNLQNDVVADESGVYYVDLQKSDNAQVPQAGDKVIVHYTGYMTKEGDETQIEVFDSSLNRGTPFQFQYGAGQVIPGWEKGLATMTKGSIRRMVIPPELAYGSNGIPGVIPPNKILIFEVQLVDIQPGR